MFGITNQKNNVPAKADARVVAPAVDVYENDEEFVVLADLPGIKQEGAQITLEHDRLSLEAKEGGRHYRREFIVPPSIDSEKVTATMKAGVLTLNLPKRAPYKPRQIQVRAS